MTYYESALVDTIESRCKRCGFVTRYPTINQKSIVLKCFRCDHVSGVWEIENVQHVKWVNHKEVKKGTPKTKTLGEWLEFATDVFGEGSPAVKFICDKIEEQGKDSHVISAPSQFTALLAHVNQNGK